MELKWLEDFISLAQTRSFSRSAEARHVTQSAFSRRIRALELWLGVNLVDRSTCPTTLTPEGRRFRDTAEEGLRTSPRRTSEEDTGDPRAWPRPAARHDAGPAAARGGGRHPGSRSPATPPITGTARSRR